MNHDVDRWMQIGTKKWFGLILPNGWFGRPFDNAHKVDEYSYNEHRLIVAFDNDSIIEILGKSLQFRIEKVPEGKVEKLIVSGFDFVNFSHQFSSSKRVEEKFEDGKLPSLGILPRMSLIGPHPPNIDVS